MKKILLILFLLFISAFNTFADTDKEQLLQALDYYNLGNYNNAIKIYETLISKGTKNSTIYYNLALSYIQNKDVGRAALNIERAMRLSPRDKDINEVKNFIYKLIEEPKQNMAERLISKIKLIISLNELTFIMFILFLTLSILFIIYCLLYRKIYLNLSIILFVLFVMFIPLLYIKVEDEILSRKAIVLVDTAVRNNPIKLEDPTFETVEGKKVIILSELGRWVNIKQEIDGLSGWVDKHSVEMI